MAEQTPLPPHALAIDTQRARAMDRVAADGDAKSGEPGNQDFARCRSCEIVLLSVY